MKTLRRIIAYWPAILAGYKALLTAIHAAEDGRLSQVEAMQPRSPLPGEDWTRGNDLSDGPLNEETWEAILADIVGYEMLSLVPERVAVEVPKVTTESE